jgi:hypothetical protein
MKPRIECFGHGWSLKAAGKTTYCGSFQECIALLDEMAIPLLAQAVHDSCVLNRLGLQETGRA